MSEPRPLRSYGRRKARPLSERKDRLLDELLPRSRLPLATPAPSPLTSLFAQPVMDVWLEIGFGSGEHLAWQAGHHPDIGCIGCEPFINGVASLLGRIEDSGLKTVRIHDGDAREVLGWLPKASIGRIFVLFPDPWPKKRHLKRRLLSPETVTQLARVLRPRRRAQICHRQRRLCWPGASGPPGERGLSVAGRERQGLAGEAARLARDALRTEGLGRGPKTGLSQFPTSLT